MISNSENAPPRKVTIEDILRIKRFERPSPEFWGEFEQQLRAKQLAAIIEKRPWWITLRLPQAARWLSRFQVPVGAAAALALSFVVVREYRPVSSAIDVATPLAATDFVTDTASFGETVVSGPGSRSSDMQASLPLTEAAEALLAESSAKYAAGRSRPTSVGNQTEISVSPVGSGALMALIPWAAPQTIAPDEREAVALGELSPVHFLPLVNPGRDHNFSGRVEVEHVVMPVSVAASDVAAPAPALAVVSPREVRRNRILSNLAVADNALDSDRFRLAQVRDVITSALDEDRLYDSVRRLGMGGDRLTLKF